MIQENKQTARELIEELKGEGNFSAASAMMAIDFVAHMPFGKIDGRDQYISSNEMMRAAFPDMKVSLTQLVAEDDMVAVRMAVSGTQLGEFLGLPPTGKKIEMNGAAFFRIANGKIVEGWSFPDLFGLMQQLGAMPELEVTQ